MNEDKLPIPPRGKVYKTDSNSNYILGDDLDYHQTDDGKFHKYRNPMTHLTPKKRKENENNNRITKL